jgi:(S)-2-hydroxyglutarate dehydrogenase
MAPECDVAVVGGGILGVAVARELAGRRPRERVVMLERESELGAHQTSHNSGVIHAGIYYAPGSLKARLCVSGARELYELCERRAVPHQRCGKVIVARDRSELLRLDELERRGRANGVPGLRRLDPAELRELEPHCRGVAALHSPATGTVDFAAVARALATEAEERGVEVRTGWPVESVGGAPGRVELGHPGAALTARLAVFCAGASADRLAVADGASPDPRIVPFRGAYMRVRRPELVRALIYPVPDPRLPFLGVHLSRHLNGEVSLGPTALLVGARDAYVLRRMRPRDLGDTLAWPGTWRMVGRFWRTGLTELRQALSRRSLARAAASYVPAIEPADLEPWFAGVRAQAVGRDGRLIDDFVVSRTERALHVRNAPSPAATSALALARLIGDEVERSLA